jgi:hypothetical protein
MSRQPGAITGRTGAPAKTTARSLKKSMIFCFAAMSLKVLYALQIWPAQKKQDIETHFRQEIRTLRAQDQKSGIRVKTRHRALDRLRSQYAQFERQMKQFHRLASGYFERKTRYR